MKVSVFGSGVMGSGISSLFSTLDEIEKLNVFVLDAGIIPTSRERILKELKLFVRATKLPKDRVDEYFSKIDILTDIKECALSDIIIEAIAENIDKKKSLIKEISEWSSENTIVVTNTSSLSITDLASCYRYPQNLLGFHFFNPIHTMQLIEVVKGMVTSDEAVSKMVDIASCLGKKAVIVNETPGFVVNRMIIPMINEAVFLLSEGVAIKEDIDKAMVLGANHPLGPLALADLIGIDVCVSILDTLYADIGDPKYRAHPLMRKYLKAGMLGKKSGCGFYHYKKFR